MRILLAFTGTAALVALAALSLPDGDRKGSMVVRAPSREAHEDGVRPEARLERPAAVRRASAEASFPPSTRKEPSPGPSSDAERLLRQLEQTVLQGRAADPLDLYVAGIAADEGLVALETEHLRHVLTAEDERQQRAYDSYRRARTDPMARTRLLLELKEVGLWKERELETRLGTKLAHSVLAPRARDVRGPYANSSWAARRGR